LKSGAKLKFWGQLGARLKKFASKDQSAKGATIEGLHWPKPGVELKKLKVKWSIRGLIDKIRDQGPYCERRVTSGFQLKVIRGLIANV